MNHHAGKTKWNSAIINDINCTGAFPCFDMSKCLLSKISTKHNYREYNINLGVDLIHFMQLLVSISFSVLKFHTCS